MSEPVLNEDQRDALQEVANLAMGQAATRLARLLDAFIELSVPRVKVVAVSEAAQALREMTGIEDSVSAVRQGFRSDIKGEALVICRSDSIEQLCSLVNDPYRAFELRGSEPAGTDLRRRQRADGRLRLVHSRPAWPHAGVFARRACSARR